MSDSIIDRVLYIAGMAEFKERPINIEPGSYYNR